MARKMILAIVAVVAALAFIPSIASATQQLPPGVTVKVVTLKTSGVGLSTKVERCIARASKWEAPSRPADPRAKCKGKVSVNVKAKAVASCKKGWMGGRATATANVRERVTVSAFAESFAAVARVRVKTVIRDRVRTRASARVDCVRVTPPPTNPPPTNPPPTNPPPTNPPPTNPPPENPPPTPKSVVILSMTDLNDIPTGKSSGPYYVEVSASDEGGSLTVDPGIGSMTDCNGGSRQGSMTVAVPKGITKFCFVIWAPDDPARPTSMTVTATAVLNGASPVQKTDNLLITYPVRPE